jgi:serine/threonine protein kinase
LAIQFDLPLFAGALESAAPLELHCATLPLEEWMGAGALGITWRSRLPDGTAVAVKRLTAVGRDLTPRLQHLQRLRDLAGPNLLDVLSVFEEEDHLWVAFRLDGGVSLSRLLERGRLRPACAVAVGAAVLDALASLHAVGLLHGAVHGRNVHVASDGSVRLGDYGLAAEPGQAPAALRAADVRAAGTLVAATLGMVLRPEAGRHARLQSSLGRAVRAITGSRRLLPTGHEAAHASLALREGARGLATARRQAGARAQLAAAVAEIMSDAPRLPGSC